MQKHVFIAGAHRGGRAISERAVAQGDQQAFSDVSVADPKESRAAQLAEWWQRHGVEATGSPDACETAIANANPDVAVMSVDTVRPMRTILAERPIATQWQILARGLGQAGPVMGIAGTVASGQSEARDDSVKLIDSLSSFIAPESSAVIRRNSMNADVLHTMRGVVSAHTARRVGIIDHDPADLKDGALNLFWGMERFPLLVIDRLPGQPFDEIRRMALHAELPRHVMDARQYSVATVTQRALEFFIIDFSQRKPTVRFYMPLVHTLPGPKHPLGGEQLRRLLGGLRWSGMSFPTTSAGESPATVTD